MAEREHAYHHGALREALLRAGDEVLSERGVDGLTLRECARRAGVSHAAPKHHFGNLHAFLIELAAGGFHRLTAQLRRDIGRAGNLDEEFIATTHAYVSFAEENPEHFRLMFAHDLMTDDGPLYQAAGETYTVLTNVILRQRGEAEIDQSELNERMTLGTLLEDVLIGWSHIHGMATLQLEHHLKMVPAGRFESLLEKASVRVGRMMRSS